MEQYYRILPSAVHEGDRLGLLSMLHPLTFVSWVIAGIVTWLASPLALGLTVLPALALVYLYATRLNSRYGYELALYDWLRNG
jgi:hypothetical protein